MYQSRRTWVEMGPAKLGIKAKPSPSKNLGSLLTAPGRFKFQTFLWTWIHSTPPFKVSSSPKMVSDFAVYETENLQIVWDHLWRRFNLIFLLTSVFTRCLWNWYCERKCSFWKNFTPFGLEFFLLKYFDWSLCRNFSLRLDVLDWSKNEANF